MEICIDVLTRSLPGVEVSSEVPVDGRPDGPYICVWRDSGGGDELLDRPRMAMVCWGPSDAVAYALALDASQALARAADAHPYLSAASCSSMSRDEWGSDGRSRYRVDMDLTINKD